MRAPSKLLALAALVVTALFAVTGAALATSNANSGAIHTTDSSCTGVNLNVDFASKQDVYLEGGPSGQGGTGLADGEYYVQVTEPDGTVLGTSVGSSDPTPVTVVNGSFVECYQLWAILIKASDRTQGYDDTSNTGGEYKVWISSTADFTNSTTKTDNFKVGPSVVTAAMFASANATRSSHGVVVRWKTAAAVNTVGFNVYRLVNGKRVKVNAHLIQTRARGAYSVLDRKAGRSSSLRYRIEAVLANGKRAWYGPVAVKRQGS